MAQIVDQIELEQLEREYQNSLVKMFCPKISSNAGNAFNGWEVHEPSPVFGELDYRYLGNLEYPKGKDCTKDGKKNSPLREDDLRLWLKCRSNKDGSPKYTSTQIEEAVSTLKKTILLDKVTNLAEVNNKVYQLLINGVEARPSPDKNEEKVMFFDFENYYSNDFALAEEVSYIDYLTSKGGDNKNARPDIVIYVNGIALAVFELKRSIVNIEHAVNQSLINQREEIPTFFTTVQFIAAASDKQVGKKGFLYGTVNTPLQFWCPWKPDTTETGIKLTDKQAIKGFFDKTVLMDMFHYGVIDDGGIKKIMRPHQLYALRAIMPRLRTKNGGVIWHSQGSGKSLTMIWIANYIRLNTKDFPDPRVIVVTDRTELDAQIVINFEHSGCTIARATSADNLLDLLASGEGWLISTLIHKFGQRIDENGKTVAGEDDPGIPLELYLKELDKILAKKYPNGFTAKGKTKFVFVDECHRTQNGVLHKAMRKILGDDVTFIGFTGTPLIKDKDDKKSKHASPYAIYQRADNLSQNRFGPFIHKYLHKNAVEDGVILDLQYEARNVETKIKKLDKVQERFDEYTKNLSEDEKKQIERKKKIEDRWATLESIYTTKERMQQIAYSIFEDMENRPLKESWCNAMLVADDIYAAFKYYQFFQYNEENTILRDRCAVVTSYEAPFKDQRNQVQDNEFKKSMEDFKVDMMKKSFENAGEVDVDGKLVKITTSELYEKWAKKLFKTKPAKMKLLIVVDKLLTGFDAPTCMYLYIDKKMEDYNLFQAICRTNRLGSDIKEADGTIIKSHKEYGMIVDFKHTFDKIQDSVTKFNEGGFSNFEADDVEGLLEDAITSTRKRLESAKEAFDSLRVDLKNQGLETVSDIANSYITPVDATEEEKQEKEVQKELFYSITSKYVRAFDNISNFIIKAGFSEDEANSLRKLSKLAGQMYHKTQIVTDDYFDPKCRDTEMRLLLDQYIHAEDFETIIPATADFSFLDKINSDTDLEELAEKLEKEAGSTQSAAEVVLAHTRSTINDYKERDQAKFDEFAPRLKALIDQINNGTISFKDQIMKQLELLKKSKEKDLLPAALNEIANIKATSVLWRNREQWCWENDEEVVMEIVKKVIHYIDFDAPHGWQDPYSYEADCVKSDIADMFKEANKEQIFEIYKIVNQNWD